jgi:RNA polymerase sigma factor (sigma-70 family)
LRLARRCVARADPMEPEDVAHEAIVALLASADRGGVKPSQIENPEAYLFTVVRHAADRVRRKRREQLVRDVENEHDSAPALAIDPAPGPEVVAADADNVRKTLESIKARLRPRDAVAFALLVEDGCDIDEVARAMGVTANHVYQMRHRILQVANDVQRELSSDPRAKLEES